MELLFIKYICGESFSFGEKLLKTFSRLLQFNIFFFWGHLFIEDWNISHVIMIKHRQKIFEILVDFGYDMQYQHQCNIKKLIL